MAAFQANTRNALSRAKNPSGRQSNSRPAGTWMFSLVFMVLRLVAMSPRPLARLAEGLGLVGEFSSKCNASIVRGGVSSACLARYAP